MLRFLFGRRDDAPMPPAAVVFGAARTASSAPHPILSRMLSEAKACSGLRRNDPAQWRRIVAPLTEATPADLMTIAHGALLRLPEMRLARLVGPGHPLAGTADPALRGPEAAELRRLHEAIRQAANEPETFALLAAIGAAANAIRPRKGEDNFPHGFSPAQMPSACRAMGDLFEREWQASTDWPADVSALFSGVLSPMRCSHAPEVDDALRGLLARLGAGGPIALTRVLLAEQIVALLDLPRSASPTLTALNADFARREAIRRRIAEVAGPELAPLTDALIDSRILWSGQKQFAALPEVVAFLARDPGVLGTALTTMTRILREFPGPDYRDWSWIARDESGFRVGPYRSPSIHSGYQELAALILRKRIEIADGPMAALVRTQVTGGKIGYDEPYRSRHFLNQALKVAMSEDGKQTRAALEWLVPHKPEPGRLPMPEDWQRPIQEALHGLAPAAPLAPPVLDLEKVREELRSPVHGREIRKLLQHFGTAFDPRLHDQAHRDFLDRLVPPMSGRLEELSRSESAYEQAQRDYVADPRAPRAETYVNTMQSLRSDVETAAVLRKVLACRDRIAARLEPVTPFVTRHPSAAEKLGRLFDDIAGKSAPAAKWLAEGEAALSGVPRRERIALLKALVEAADVSAPEVMSSHTCLRGLIYLASRWDVGEVAPLLTDFALRDCFQHQPNQGIRNEKLGNACLWTLIHLPDGAGVPYVARLLTRVKYPKVRTRIDAALNETAAKAGVTRGTLDEMTVPAHDLDADGQVAFDIGGGRAIVALTGNKSAEVRWFAADGKALKAPNAAMKGDKDALKQVKAAAKEIEADLATQIVRLQRLYLDDRSWSVAEWRCHYLDHPLMAGLTRRLLWWLDRDGTSRAVLPQDTQFTDVAGTPVDADGATLRLWHPIDADPAEVLAWRDRIEALALVQPFAQVWREIYRLTDAERATATYSNRWSGHILRQHQVMALARLNGWSVTHRMWYDVANDEAWHLTLPKHRLVADYWIEGAGDHDDPERLESNAYVYVTSDRLAFSRIADGARLRDSAHGPQRAEPVPLAELPPLVLSEVMRHCDLFTAVASIASDPAWRDRGAQAEHPSGWRRAAVRYWEQQSFGDLSEAARTRHALLARIVPKLAIADRCTLDSDALRVRGKRHNYRIHLGSAAIMIEDQRRHLCIVSAMGSEKYYVPFEGDHTTSLIISKAVLLANDDKVADPTILRQL